VPSACPHNQAEAANPGYLEHLFGYLTLAQIFYSGQILSNLGKIAHLFYSPGG
jgi:hypothetical protein